MAGASPISLSVGSGSAAGAERKAIRASIERDGRRGGESFLKDFVGSEAGSRQVRRDRRSKFLRAFVGSETGYRQSRQAGR